MRKFRVLMPQPTIDQQGAEEKVRQGGVLLDVRSAREFSGGTLPGAIHVSFDQVEQRVPSIVPDFDTPIVTFCRSSVRAEEARLRLKKMGYKDVENLGSYKNWKMR